MVEDMEESDELKTLPEDEEDRVSEFNQLADVEHPAGSRHPQSLGVHRQVHRLTTERIGAGEPSAHTKLVA